MERQKVLYARYSGSEFKLDEIEYLIIPERDVLAIVGNGQSRRT